MAVYEEHSNAEKDRLYIKHIKRNTDVSEDFRLWKNGFCSIILSQEQSLWMSVWWKNYLSVLYTMGLQDNGLWNYERLEIMK